MPRFTLTWFLALSLILLSGCALTPPSYKPTADELNNSSAPSLATTPTNSANTNTSTTMPQPPITQAVLRTNLGNITIKFYTESPNTVANFIKLASAGFYNDTKFHRVIKQFMIQGGDPNSKDDDWSNDGTGGPGYKFKDEFNSHPLVRGSLAMANAGPDTNGSQFFIVTAPSTPWLDGKHTNFGQITAGMDIVDKIEQAKTNSNDHPLTDITIQSIELK